MSILLRRLVLAAIAAVGPVTVVAEVPDLPAEIARLIRQLGDDDFDKREAAAKALEAIGPPAFDPLDKALMDRDLEIARRAVEVLEAIEKRTFGDVLAYNGRALHAWRRDLAGKTAAERLAAVKALGYMVIGAERIVPALAPVLADPDPALRREAFESLGKFGVRARPVLKEAAAALADPDAKLRKAAARIVWAADADAARAVPVLVGLLGEDDETLRRQVVVSLLEMGPAAKDARPALVKALADPDPGVKTQAAIALWQIGRDDDDARAAFLATAKTGEMYLGQEALRHLHRTLPLKADLGPVFVGYLGHENPRFRSEAVRGVASLDELPADARAGLLAVAAGQDKFARLAAIRAVGDLAATDPVVVRALARALDDGDAEVRRAGLVALGRSGPAARAVLPAIRAAGKAPHTATDALALAAKLGDTEAALPELRALLNDKTQRSAALRVLADLGPKAAPAIPDLIELLDDGYTNSWTIATFGKIGPAAVEPLVAALGHKRAQVAMKAAYALAEIGPKAVPALAKVVEDGPATPRWLAAHGLSLIGPDAAPALKEILAGLKTTDATLRRSCARAVGRIDPLGKESFPVLVALVKDGDSSNRIAAIEALRDLGARAKDALPALREELKATSLKLNVAEAIARIDPTDREAVQLVLDATRAEAKTARAAAFRMLAGLGPAGTAGLPLAAAALADPDVFVRQAAFAALLELLPHAKAEAFTAKVLTDCRQGLRDRFLLPNADARVRFAEALGRLGPAGKPLLPLLLEALRGVDRSIHPGVAVALWKIDRSPLAVPALAETLSLHPNTEIRTAAANALAEIGPDARLGLPALIRACQLTGLTNTGEFRIRPAAARAVVKVEPKLAAWAVPVLLESLRDAGYPDARAQAAQALGEIGADAKPALGWLRRAANAPEEVVRVAAAEAIKRIEP